MSHPNRSGLSTALVLALLALGLAALRHQLAAAIPTEPAEPQPRALPLLPPAFPPQDIVGRWGLAAYHKEEDRARIEAAAANHASSLTSSRSARPAA